MLLIFNGGLTIFVAMSNEANEFRSLAAIMFTDMVGFSAAAQRNESLALELLRLQNDRIRSILPGHRGAEIKTIGDAFLVEFSSALNAVECAIDIQRSFDEYNAHAPADRRILVRIGIHLGDVIHRDNDVFGDGVNIAARIEPVSPPGGITLSEDVVRQIRNKIPYPVEELSEHRLKNISLPVTLYSVVLPWQPKTASTAPAKVAVRTVQSSTVAVLPFNTIGGGSDDYFSEGMTEEIISSLSKISGLDVIARTSAFKFRHSQDDVSTIAEQLGAGNILGGTVRRSGDKARISIRLMDTRSQKIIWTEDFTKDLNDIFSVQSDVAMNVASSLKIKLMMTEKENVQRKSTTNSVSYQNYLLGRFHLNKRTGDSISTAIRFFGQSITDDPHNASSYAGLAEAYTLAGVAGYGSLNKQESITRAREYSERAIALDDSLAEAHLAKAYVKFRIDWEWSTAEREFIRSIELKPGLAKARELYALFLAIHRRFPEAIEQIERAHELDPLSASVNTGYGRFLFFSGAWEKALQQLRYVISIEPNYAEAHFGLCDYYIYHKNYEEALASAENALALSGRRPIILSTIGFIKAKLGDIRAAEQILEEIRNSDQTSGSTKFAQSNICLALNRIDEAIALVSEAIDERDGMAIYINMDPTFFGGNTAAERMRPLLEKIGFINKS